MHMLVDYALLMVLWGIMGVIAISMLIPDFRRKFWNPLSDEYPSIYEWINTLGAVIFGLSIIYIRLK